MYQLLKDNLSEEVRYKMGVAPIQKPALCFAIVQPGKHSLMHEVDVVRICDEAVSHYFKQYKIRINSTQILDCIFEECSIPINERAFHMLQLADGNC